MKSQKNVWLIAGVVVLLVTGLTLMPAMAQEDVKEKVAPAVSAIGEKMSKDKPAEVAADAECAKPGVCPQCGCGKEKLDEITAALEKAEKAIADGDMDAAKKAISKAKMQLKMMASKCDMEKAACPMCKPGQPCLKCAAKAAKKAEKPAEVVEPVAPVAPVEPAAPAVQ